MEKHKVMCNISYHKQATCQLPLPCATSLIHACSSGERLATTASIAAKKRAALTRP